MELNKDPNAAKPPHMDLWTDENVKFYNNMNRRDLFILNIREILQREYDKLPTDTNHNFLSRLAQSVYDSHSSLLLELAEAQEQLIEIIQKDEMPLSASQYAHRTDEVFNLKSKITLLKSQL